MGTGVDALPYVDALIKEYLLFRGFTATLSAFNKVGPQHTQLHTQHQLASRLVLVWSVCMCRQGSGQQLVRVRALTHLLPRLHCPHLSPAGPVSGPWVWLPG